MKKLFLLIAGFVPFGLAACGNENNGFAPDTPAEPAVPEPIEHFVRGADISWYTEMEADGKRFYNAQGQERTCPALMKEIGMNAVRLRVWVNPRNKGCLYSDAADVAAKAKASWQAGLNVMVDFHFSDWWADPSRQELPADWAGRSLDELKQRVAEHVGQTLRAVTGAGATVAWIQIGNETRNGMMHPYGQLWNNEGNLPDGWKNFAALYMAGYKAAKAVCPQALVMPHLNHAYEDNGWWFKELKAAGGTFDMIALSHYPQADNDSQSWQELNRAATTQIRQLAKDFGVPVIVSEFGVRQSNPALGAEVAADFMQRVRPLGPSICAGVFYWEPEVYGNWKPSSYDSYGWGAYDQGAFTADGKPSSILQSWSK